MSIAILWFRRDLRLADNPALQAALEAGHRVLPVYIHAPAEEAPWSPGAASGSWLHRSLQALSADLERRGSGLLLRAGDSLVELRRLQRETGAVALYCNRVHEPAAIARDRRVAAAWAGKGLEFASFNASLLLEPGRVRSASGAAYRVFTPFWKSAARLLDTRRPQGAPPRLPPLPASISGAALASLSLAAFGLAPAAAWDRKFWRSGWQPGEAGAAGMLDAFVEGAAHGYARQRDLPDRIGTSRLSPHLHFGELSPGMALARVRAARQPAVPAEDLARFETELGWREFAAQILLENPHLPERDLDPGFRHFDWVEPDPERLRAWQQGRTGVPLVDAGMRELWQTGWMHNRVRMVVASFLTKNLRYHWRHGARWFWDTLLDADLANNSQGWQWSAGTGADAAPYFRVFSPSRQAERFDPRGAYLRRWLPERATGTLPTPIIDLGQSRLDALQAYRQRRSE